MNCCDRSCSTPLPPPGVIARPEIARLIAQLAQAPLFDSLAAAELERIARGVREIRVGKGEILFHRGDPCTGFHLLLSGQIKLAFTSAEGNEKVVEILRPGQSFGEAVMFMDKPYVLMAQALTEARLLHVGKQGFFEEMDHDPSLCRKIIAGLSRRLHHLIADVESYSLRSGRDRIIGYLLHEDETTDPGDPQAGSGRISIRLPTSKGTIASRLNLTQEHFSRILHDLVGSGLIEVEGRTIHIPDLGRLRASLG